MIPADHLSRVIDAFVARLDLGKFGFAKASAAATGRPPHVPTDLLKFYVYGYLQQVRSSRWIARQSPSSAARKARRKAMPSVAALERQVAAGRALTEPEARMMQGTKGPAYTVQNTVDGRHGVILAHAVTEEISDCRSLQPLAEAALAS